MTRIVRETRRLHRIGDHRLGPPLCLTAIWALMVLLAYPVGVFPLNDS
ncbi:MAG: hypothetical protein GX806_00405 [Lentisphaerae bacterium]|nr:hypothetical protein [Lentisphaerota bacterium]